MPTPEHRPYGIRKIHRTDAYTLGRNKKKYQLSQLGKKVPRHAGLFLTTDRIDTPESLMPLEILSNPGVHGVMMRPLWYMLQPTSTTYDFSSLDYYVDEVARLRTLGIYRKMGISVFFASEVPAWAQPGTAAGDAMQMTTWNVPQGTEPETYRVFQVAPPWNVNYQSAHNDLHVALYEYFAGKGVLDQVAYIRNGSVATDGAELGLPRPSGNNEKKGDPTNPINIQWVAYGYTPDKVEEGFLAMIGGIMNAFPRLRVGQGLFEGDGFPQIDNTSTVVGGPVTRDQVITAAIEHADIGPRFGVGDQSLVRVPEDRDTYEIDFHRFVRQGAHAFFQTNKYVGRAGCPRETPESEFDKDRPCLPDEYLELLKTGFELGDVIEIWPEDAVEHTTVLQDAWAYKMGLTGWEERVE